MAAMCEASAAHLGLARLLESGKEQQHHLEQALESSQAALEIYQSCGFVRPVECLSEEILYRHSLVLTAVGRNEEAAHFLRLAHNEVQRKYDLIPPDSHYRQTFLDNIRLHREIRAAVGA
jgi:hypothetical protein